jgi:hypothetical protein
MLSASSPSDSEHRFSQCEIKSNYPFHYVEDLDLAPGIVDFHQTHITDPFRRHFHRGCPPPLDGEHIKRVQGTPLRLEQQRGEQGRFLSPYKTLPAVPMVKGLVMRRQFRRGIHVATLSWLLSQSFVALEWFRFERSISMNSRKQVSFDKGTKRRQLLFEKASDEANTISQAYSCTYCRLCRKHCANSPLRSGKPPKLSMVLISRKN